MKPKRRFLKRPVRRARTVSAAAPTKRYQLPDWAFRLSRMASRRRLRAQGRAITPPPPATAGA